VSWTLFGFQIGKDTEEAKRQASTIPSFVPPENLDAAVELPPGGSQGLSLDLDGSVRTEVDLINRYRDLSLQPEVEQAVEDIVNEAIVMDSKSSPVEIDLDDVDQPDAIKKKIQEEFDGILNLLNFQNMCYDIFRRWYVDGRLYYHIMVSETAPREGIKELRYIDPRRLRKVREPLTRTPLTSISATNPKDVKIPAYQEYYYYKPQIQSTIFPGMNQTLVQSELRVSADAICYTHSGFFDTRNMLVLSHLHKAIKPMNQLRTMEDAVVIYRLARAPERRVFYIDVGNMPKVKAEQHMNEIMTRNKNRLVYDAKSGEIRDDRKFMTMLEDYYLARREGGKGTEISTLAGGLNLGEMTDVEYFKKRLYKSLHVPVSRMESEGAFNLGRASEITRDELKFAKFIQRLRLRFSHIFDNLLEIQLSLKGVMRRSDWHAIRNHVRYNFQENNFFAESKMSEIMATRLATLAGLQGQIGVFYSKEWVRRNVLMMNENDITQMQKEINAELKETAQDNEQRTAMGLPPVDAMGMPMMQPSMMVNDPNVPGAGEEQGMGLPMADPGMGLPMAKGINVRPPQPEEPKSRPFTRRGGNRKRVAPSKNEAVELSPEMTDDDRRLIESMTKVLNRAACDIRDEI
jgi:hypothetical protein